MYSKTILIGRVGRDPTIKDFERKGKEDSKLASFTLATDRAWYKDGDKTVETTWHRINVVNTNVSKIVEKYVSKGDLLTVEGRIQEREYEKDGEKKRSFEVVIDYEGRIVLMPRSYKGEEKAETKTTSQEEPIDDFEDVPF